ncbi:MAG TPA: 50S ribosomal protein L10 [Spirochaetota bacterium]|nr:50S ribosomal protein L10 [Spirochaetota bacterium]
MPQQYKIDKINSLTEVFNNSNGYIFTDFRGLTVDVLTDLRRKLRKLNSKYIVIKNNYIKILAKNRGIEDLKDSVVGPTAVAFIQGDFSEAAKVLLEISKNSNLKIKGGWVDGLLLDVNQVEALSKLPSKTQLIAMLMSVMNAPVQKFAYACNDVISRFVRVVNAVAEQKKGA